MSDQSGAPAKNVGTPVVTVQELTSKYVSTASQAGSNITNHRGFARGISVITTLTNAVTILDGTKIIGFLPAATPAGTPYPMWDQGVEQISLSYTNGTGALLIAFKTF